MIRVAAFLGCLGLLTGNAWSAPTPPPFAGRRVAPASRPYPAQGQARPAAPAVTTPAPAPAEATRPGESPLRSATSPSARAGTGASSVDLNKLESHVSANKADKLSWKAYFDLALLTRPGVPSHELTFANLHSFLFLDILPDSGARISFDVSSSRGSPSFFQFDYDVTPRLTMSAGKIFVPFGEMDPHHLFGGRVGSNDPAFTQPGQTAVFLPNLWTDLGVAAKYQLVDQSSLNLMSHLFIVNGFQGNGTDPKGASGNVYPSFADTTLTSRDNNRDKAIGARLHALMNRKFGIGVSGYTARWNDQSMSKAYRVNIYEMDVMLRLAIAEIRASAIQMMVTMPGDNFRRGGFFGEIGFNSRDRKWKFLLREGSIQLDNRVLDKSDQTTLGAKLIYRPNWMTWSFELSRDMLERAGKVGRTIGIARLILEL